MKKIKIGIYDGYGSEVGMDFDSVQEAIDYLKAFAEQNDLENFGDEKDNGDSEKRSDLEAEGVTIEK